MRWVPGNRAQSSGIIVFALIIAVSALIWGLADPAVQDITNQSLNNTSDQDAKDRIETRQKIWNNILYFSVAFGGMVLLLRAILQSRGR